MAGYPSNTIQDLSIKFFEFAALALATFGLAPIQWFKILAFLAMAAVPWMMYFAGRNLFFDRDDIRNSAALLAAFFGTAYWWNAPLVGAQKGERSCSSITGFTDSQPPRQRESFRLRSLMTRFLSSRLSTRPPR